MNNLPNFSQLKPQEIPGQLTKLLDENREQLHHLLQNTKNFAWNNLMPLLEEIDDSLAKFWSPISHLHAVQQTPEWRDIYNTCLPQLTTYSTELEQNINLYNAFKYVADANDYQQLNPVQQKIIKNQLRDFKLGGVDLPQDKKKRYAEIQEELSQLTTKFSENGLDATQHWTYHTTDSNELEGVPEHTLINAKQAAEAKGLTGWLLTLDFPCYFSVISQANNRELRKLFYTAYTTRASDQGPEAKQFDNSQLMLNILKLRHELSLLLGFDNYAELSLATKMAKKPEDVIAFLNGLAVKAQPHALKELAELQTYAKQQDSNDELELAAWDIAYYSEKLQHEKFGINDEILRPYFPVEKVLNGLFELTKILYGMHISELKNVDTWHPDVRFFTIRDQQGHLRGQFYLDLFARKQKRDGAWMDDYCSRRRLANNTVQTPTAYLTCNLTGPAGDKPALLTHDEVLTIFHEYGHGLHHMLTQVDYAAAAGIHGVEWDAVELPSQFMENFAWEKSVLDMISGHYQTGETLPEELLKQLRAAKTFQAGLRLVRQLEFALFDFLLHWQFDPHAGYEQIQMTLDKVRQQVSVLPIPAFNRFQHSFSHIFAGGYAAGYYSYLWAEMLSTDAFEKFLEHGIFDSTTGQQFLQCILEKGGSKDALDLFIDFRERQPRIDALLREYGIN